MKRDEVAVDQDSGDVVALVRAAVSDELLEADQPVGDQRREVRRVSSQMSSGSLLELRPGAVLAWFHR